VALLLLLLLLGVKHGRTTVSLLLCKEQHWSIVKHCTAALILL
jgi:hypothetical protein